MLRRFYEVVKKYKREFGIVLGIGILSGMFIFGPLLARLSG